MPYAIELYFDVYATAQVAEIHSMLREAGITIDEGTVPHVSLCIYRDLPIADFEKDLIEFAKQIKPFDTVFSRVDAFRTERPVLFLAPEHTPELRDVHDKFHHSFSKYAEQAWEHYLQNVWVPHCTLCMNLTGDMYERAAAILKEIALPITARFERIGILKFSPNKQLTVIDLG